MQTGSEHQSAGDIQPLKGAGDEPLETPGLCVPAILSAALLLTLAAGANHSRPSTDARVDWAAGLGDDPDDLVGFSGRGADSKKPKVAAFFLSESYPRGGSAQLVVADKARQVSLQIFHAPARQRSRRRDDARRAVARPRKARGVADRRGVLSHDEGEHRWPWIVQKTATRVPWLFENTDLSVGSSFSLAGVEADHVTSASPRRVVVVAKVPNLYEDGRDSHMTYYETRAGAKAFAAGAFSLTSAIGSEPVKTLMENLWEKLSKD